MSKDRQPNANEIVIETIKVGDKLSGQARLALRDIWDEAKGEVSDKQIELGEVVTEVSNSTKQLSSEGRQALRDIRGEAKGKNSDG
jgi:hypothetical protein